jgi:hypothetical protein
MARLAEEAAGRAGVTGSRAACQPASSNLILSWRNGPSKGQRSARIFAERATKPTAPLFTLWPTTFCPRRLPISIKKPLKDFDEAETALMNLMLSLAHVALSIEVQGSEDARHREVRAHMKITRSPADRDG